MTLMGCCSVSEEGSGLIHCRSEFLLDVEGVREAREGEHDKEEVVKPA